MEWCADSEWWHWSEIARGLIYGVGAGVVVSVILGAYALIKTWLARRRQIAFIREYVLKGFEKIGKLEDVKVGSTDEMVASAESRWVTELKIFLRRLASVTERRTSAMNAAQLTDLHLALSDAQLLKTVYRTLDRRQDSTVHKGAFATVYKLFSKIQWLNLPPKAPWESADDLIATVPKPEVME